MEEITKISETRAEKTTQVEPVVTQFTLDDKLQELAGLERGIISNQTQIDYLQAEMAKVQVDIDKLILLGVKTEAEVKELEETVEPVEPTEEPVV